MDQSWSSVRRFWASDKLAKLALSKRRDGLQEWFTRNTLPVVWLWSFAWFSRHTGSSCCARDSLWTYSCCTLCRCLCAATFSSSRCCRRRWPLSLTCFGRSEVSFLSSVTGSSCQHCVRKPGWCRMSNLEWRCSCFAVSLVLKLPLKSCLSSASWFELQRSASASKAADTSRLLGLPPVQRQWYWVSECQDF